MNRLQKVFGVTSFALAGFLIGCFTEDGGECSAGAPCPNRGEACDDSTKTCEPQQLDVDGTADAPAPADFTETLPFFRGTVCAPTNVQPGDTIPVHIEMCVHTCVDTSGHKYKSQYKCNGSFCESALVVYSPGAQGTACPPDVFGKFAKASCQYIPIDATMGPFTIPNTGAITGTGSLELPFLSNADIKAIVANDTTEAVWGAIYQYPQDPGRVFQLTMSGSNAKAPANCTDDPSKCSCKDIGF